MEFGAALLSSLQQRGHTADEFCFVRHLSTSDGQVELASPPACAVHCQVILDHLDPSSEWSPRVFAPRGGIVEVDSDWRIRFHPLVEN